MRLLPPRARVVLLLGAGAALALGASEAGAAETGGRTGSGYGPSFRTRPPADASPLPVPGCRNAAPGWVRAEESRAGTSAWRDARPGGPVQGWVDATAAVCGQRVGLHLAGGRPVVVSAYRLGWYRGAGARLVWTSGVLRPDPSAVPAPDARGTVETTWPPSTMLPVGPDWAPGMYLLVARPAGRGRGPGATVPLVVRGTGRHAALVVASTMTWQAYNSWGGRSLYAGPKDDYAARARIVSFDRPYDHKGLDHVLLYTAPLARFLDRMGLDADWTTDVELSAGPSAATAARALVFAGHSEYWTRRLFDGVEAARNSGVNLVFTGANSAYWQARLAPDAQGRRRRRVVVFKDAGEDRDASRPDELTVRWQDRPLARDEAEVVGMTFGAAAVRGGFDVADAPRWLLAGVHGDARRALPDAVGNEVDTTDGVARQRRSPRLQVLLRGTWAGPSGQVGSYAATYYTTPRGAGVFDLGTTAWDCALDRSCPWNHPSEQTSAAMRAITANVLRAATTPGFCAGHPSRASAPTTPAALRSRQSRRTRGVRRARTHGGLDDD